MTRMAYDTIGCITEHHRTIVRAQIYSVKLVGRGLE